MSGELPLNVEWTNVFKRDYKRVMKRNLDISLLDEIIGKLSRRETLSPKIKTTRCTTIGRDFVNVTSHPTGFSFTVSSMKNSSSP